MDKLKARLLSMPKNFSWNELKKLLQGLGYRETQAGRTSGSRVRFVHEIYPPITLHKPHPSLILRAYQVKQIVSTLQHRGQL